MKMRFPAYALILPLLLGLVACNQKMPADRSFIELAGQSDDDDDDDDDGPEVRPSNAVFFNQDNFCGCNNGKNILISNTNCNNICATQHANTGGVDTLFVSFNISSDVELNERLGSARAWCESPLDTGLPSCVIEAQSNDGGAPVVINSLSFSGPNTLPINISNLAPGKAYILVMKETGSGSMATSDAIQLVRPLDGAGDPGGTLAIQPVTQFSCVNRVLQTTSMPDGVPTQMQIESSYKQHFYFIEWLRPEAVPKNPQVFCHNIIASVEDNASLARLEETPNALILWDAQDVRFQLENGNTAIDKRIHGELLSMGVRIPADTQFFGKLTVSRGANVENSGTVASTAGLGYYMRTFIDTSDPARPVAYCPTQAHYEGSDKLFQVLGQYLQVDTEGIYLARRETAYYQDNGVSKCLPDDFIIAKEGDLKQAWFYYNSNRTPVRPTTVSEIRNNTLYFHYPYNFDSPTIRQSHQKSYTVISPDNPVRCVADGGTPNTNDATNTPYNSSVMPHDKRFGCVPKP